MWSPKHRASAVRVSRYWNALVGGEPAQDVELLSAELDPEIVSDIALVRRAYQRQIPDQAFIAKLEDEIMHTVTLTQPIQPVATRPRDWSPNGRVAALPRTESRPGLARPGHRRIGLPVASAAALLVLLLAAGAIFLAGGLDGLPFRNERPGGLGESIPAAVQASPEPEATPGPIIDGIAQFLWATDAEGPGVVERPGLTNIAPDGRIWISEAGSGRILIYDADGTFVEAWGEKGTGQGQFDFFSPEGADLGDVAFAADGSFFVADTGKGRVQKFAADRNFLLAWGDAGDGTGEGELSGPGSIVIMPDGTLLVADYERNDIQRFDADGAFLGTFARAENATAALRGPAGISLAPDGTVWVAAAVGNRVLRFDADGALLATIDRAGERSLGEVWEVAFDAAGNAHVADYYAATIYVFAPDGTYLTQWGDPGSELGQFGAAGSILIDEHGVAYVGKFGPVQAFQLLPLPDLASPEAGEATPSS